MRRYTENRIIVRIDICPFRNGGFFYALPNIQLSRVEVVAGFEKKLFLPILYLSKYIIEHRTDYQRLLLGVTKSDEWEPWILFMMDGIEETARFTHGKAISIKQLLEMAIDKARTELPSRVYSKELIELLFVMPYCRIQSVVDAGIAERQTAASYLDECARIGILRKQKIGRENIYMNTGLLKLLSK